MKHGPEPKHREAIDGVRVRLEPGWWILKHDELAASIRNESDEDRFEFTVQLRRIDLSAISPPEFLRLVLLLDERDPERKDRPLCESVTRASARRWNVNCHGHTRRGRVYLASSRSRRWMHTREIDSPFTKYRSLVTSHDGRRGLLIRCMDIEQLTTGREEARRIFDSIGFDEPDDAPEVEHVAPAENYLASEEEVMELPLRDRAKWCEETGDKWYAEARTADAIAAFITLIETELEAGERPTRLGHSYARLARTLVSGRLLEQAETAFHTALSLMKTGGEAPEIMAAAHVNYGVALYEESDHFVDAVASLRNALEILDGSESSETLIAAEYHIGFALKRQYEAMLQFDSEVRALRKPKAWAELSSDEREAVESYVEAKGWRRFRPTKRESMARLRSAIARMERLSPSSPRLEIARTALRELATEKNGLWIAITRIWS